MRLFLDANVLFSAFHSPGGRALALFRLAEIGRATLVASSHIVEEARRNLVTRSNMEVGDFDRLTDQLERVPEAPPKVVTWASGHDLSANDAPVLAAAVVCRADLLVTGDRTLFGHLFGSELGGVTLVSMCEALRRMLEAFDE